MGDTTDQLLTAEQAGRLLSLKTSTIRRLTHTRELPCVRPTGRRCVRYRLSDLHALILMRSQPARTEVGRRRHRPAGHAPEQGGHHQEGESKRPDRLSE